MSRRLERVAEILQQQLSHILNKDLSEKYGLITVACVVVSSDIKEAKVFISLLDKKQENKLIKEIEDTRNHIQIEIASRIQLRRTPRLVFKIDKIQDRITKVEKLLEEIESES